MSAIVGIDPGSRWVGWARLYMDRGRAIYGGAGVLDVEALEAAGVASWLAAVVSETEGQIDVAVEVIREVRGRGVMGAKRAGDLYRSGLVTGRILHELAPYAPREVAAEDVRAHFVAPVGPREAAARKAAGQRAKVDGAVRALVLGRVQGWPSKLIAGDASGAARSASGHVLAKHASHAFDAAAVGLYARESCP